METTTNTAFRSNPNKENEVVSVHDEVIQQDTVLQSQQKESQQEVQEGQKDQTLPQQQSQLAQQQQQPQCSENNDEDVLGPLPETTTTKSSILSTGRISIREKVRAKQRKLREQEERIHNLLMKNTQDLNSLAEDASIGFYSVNTANSSDANDSLNTSWRSTTGGGVVNTSSYTTPLKHQLLATNSGTDSTADSTQISVSVSGEGSSPTAASNNTAAAAAAAAITAEFEAKTVSLMESIQELQQELKVTKAEKEALQDEVETQKGRNSRQRIMASMRMSSTSSIQSSNENEIKTKTKDVLTASSSNSSDEKNTLTAKEKDVLVKMEHQLSEQNAKLESYEDELMLKRREIQILQKEMEDKVHRMVELEVDLESHDVHFTSYSEEQYQLGHGAIDELNAMTAKTIPNPDDDGKTEIPNAVTNRKLGKKSKKLINKLLEDLKDMEKRYKTEKTQHIRDVMMMEEEHRKIKRRLKSLQKQQHQQQEQHQQDQQKKQSSQKQQQPSSSTSLSPATSPSTTNDEEEMQQIETNIAERYPHPDSDGRMNNSKLIVDLECSIQEEKEKVHFFKQEAIRQHNQIELKYKRYSLDMERVHLENDALQTKIKRLEYELKEKNDALIELIELVNVMKTKNSSSSKRRNSGRRRFSFRRNKKTDDDNKDDPLLNNNSSSVSHSQLLDDVSGISTSHRSLLGPSNAGGSNSDLLGGNSSSSKLLGASETSIMTQTSSTKLHNILEQLQKQQDDLLHNNNKSNTELEIIQQRIRENYSEILKLQTENEIKSRQIYQLKEDYVDLRTKVEIEKSNTALQQQLKEQQKQQNIDSTEEVDGEGDCSRSSCIPENNSNPLDNNDNSDANKKATDGVKQDQEGTTTQTTPPTTASAVPDLQLQVNQLRRLLAEKETELLIERTKNVAEKEGLLARIQQLSPTKGENGEGSNMMINHDEPVPLRFNL